MNVSTYQPKPRFRVLATDWEGESHTECWTETQESAEAIAAALKRSGSDVSVQVDRVVRPSKP